MTRLVAGIDGGQSSTAALVADERGRVLARGTAGPADEAGLHAGATSLRDALQGALADALRSAALPGETEFDAIVAGVSGYEGRVYGEKPQMRTARFILMHDAPVAHAGALSGGAGVVVIAGTGSVVFARDERGATATLGGWGYLFGDEGSAFKIACDSLALLMRARDDGDAALDEERRLACEFFSIDSLHEIARAFYSGAITRERLAAFAPVAIGSPRFRALAERGVDRLAELAVQALASMNLRTVALTGGVLRDAGLYGRVRGGVVAQAPNAEVIAGRYEPAAGALLLAYRELGLPIKELGM